MLTYHGLLSKVTGKRTIKDQMKVNHKAMQLIGKVIVASVWPGVRCRKVFRLRIREIMFKHTLAMAESTQDGLNDMIDVFITIRANMESIEHAMHSIK